MANIADTNHFDATNEYNIAEWSSSNNIVFFDIVNCVEVMASRENMSYAEKFTPNKAWNDGNKVDAWWTKRNGMTVVMEMNSMYLAEEVTIDYHRFSLRVSKESTDWKKTYAIYRQDNSYKKWCQKVMRCWRAGERCQLYTWEIGECDHPTIWSIVGPSWFPEASVSGVAFNRYVDGIIQWWVKVPNWLSLEVGDYVYIDTFLDGRTPLNEVWLWQWRQVVWINTDWSVIVNAPWVWLVDPTAESEEVSSSGVLIKFFKEIWDILYVNTIDGIWMLHTSRSECGNKSISILWATFQKKYPITDVVNYNGKLAFITWWSIFFAAWWSNVWIIENQIQIGDQYDKILPMDHYLILMWPNKSNIVYNWNRDNNGALVPRLYDKWNDFNFWYFNVWSYKRYTREWNDEFIIYDSWGRLMKYDLYANDDWFGNVIFKLSGTEIWNRIVRKYLQMMWLSRENGAEVYIDERKEWFRVWLTDSTKDADQEKGTIILHFDEHGKYWHRRVICWIKLVGEFCWLWRWNRYVVNEWTKDNGNPIKQIVNTYHGDRTRRSNKEYEVIGFHLDYNTHLSKWNHHVKVIEHMEWLKKPAKYSSLHENIHLQRWNKARMMEPWKLLKKEMAASIFTDEKTSSYISEDFWKHVDAYCEYTPWRFWCATIKASKVTSDHRWECYDESDGKDGNKKTRNQYSYLWEDCRLWEDIILYDRSKYVGNKLFVELMADNEDYFTIYGFHFSSKYRDVNVHSQSVLVQKNDAFTVRERYEN